MTKNNCIVVVDFSGTLIKPFVAEEANKRRYVRLGLELPSEADRKRAHGTKEHYDPLRAYIGEKFGIQSHMKIFLQQDHGETRELTGIEYETKIMTDLFRDEILQIANEQGGRIYSDGILDALRVIQRRGYKLAIVSGMRTDIITGIFAITECSVNFDFVYGQDSILSRDDSHLLTKELAEKGTIEYIIGDKLADLEPATALGAKSIFFKGGHPTGGEEEFADFTITYAKELEELIK